MSPAVARLLGVGDLLERERVTDLNVVVAWMVSLTVWADRSVVW